LLCGALFWIGGENRYLSVAASPGSFHVLFSGLNGGLCCSGVVLGSGVVLFVVIGAFVVF